MNIDRKLVDLGIAIAKNLPSTFSINEMEDSFRKNVAELVCNEEGKVDYYKWKANNIKIFELMSEILSEVEPKKMTRAFEQFADIKVVRDGQKARFELKKGRRNVKRFVTKVAAAGVYERVRLDRDYFESETYAHGGAVYQTFEAFLAGRESLTEVLNIFMEELEDYAYADLVTALEGVASGTALPAANKATSVGGFISTDFDKVLNTVSAYGSPVIITTRAFAASNLLPASGWVSPNAMDELMNKGYIGMYKGAPVVILEQTFADNTNAVKMVNEKFAYIVPAGAIEKPIKMTFEGSVKIREVEREDWSTEMQIYRKLGVAVVNAHSIGIFQIS